MALTYTDWLCGWSGVVDAYLLVRCNHCTFVSHEDFSTSLNEMRITCETLCANWLTECTVTCVIGLRYYVREPQDTSLVADVSAERQSSRSLHVSSLARQVSR